MINRFTRAQLGPANSRVNSSQAFALTLSDIFNGFRLTARYTLIVAGIAAILALASIYVKPELAEHLTAMSPFSNETTESTAVAQEMIKLTESPALQKTALVSADANVTGSKLVHLMEPTKASAAGAHLDQQTRVTNWIAKRYRVAEDATKMLVAETFTTANQIKMDPLLILAVIGIESRFNPFAESPVGAQGLMQVMSKIHRDKFANHGGVKAALNPVANMKVGSQILKEYVKRGGSVEAGLKMYVGAANMETDQGYGAKVLAEYNRLREVATGKKVSVHATGPRPESRKSDKIEPQKPELLLEAEADSGFDGKPA